MLKGLAVILTVALIVVIVFVAIFSWETFMEYFIQLLSSLTVSLIALWLVAYRKEINTLKTKETENVSTVSVSEQQVVDESVKESKVFCDRENSKNSIKNSIYLPNINSPDKLNIDNSLIDNVYDKALKMAVSIFSDSELSMFSIMVDPYNALCPESGEQPHVLISYYFYSKNAKKTCLIMFDETDGLRHKTPDEDARYIHEISAFSKVPWKGSNWQEFIIKAFEREKPISENSYYNLIVIPFDKKLPWSIVFHDTFNGSRHSYDWNGKGKDLKSIIIETR